VGHRPEFGPLGSWGSKASQRNRSYPKLALRAQRCGVVPSTAHELIANMLTENQEVWKQLLREELRTLAPLSGAEQVRSLKGGGGTCRRGPARLSTRRDVAQ
jgi:hypothetical protein